MRRSLGGSGGEDAAEPGRFEQWLGVPASAVGKPIAVVFGVAFSVFGWPLLVRGVFGTEMSSGVLMALLMAPLLIIPGVLIGPWGHGRAIPPPGDHVMETLPIYGRYHRVHSLRGRTAVFGTLLLAAIVLAVLSGVAGNLGL